MTDRELLQAIYSDTQELKQKVSNVENDTQELKQEVSILKNDTLELKQDVSILKNDTLELKQKVLNVENDVANIKLTLENEISVNIQRVAEGHLDLSRDLKDAIKTNSEVEMLAIKVNMLDTGMRELKHKIS